MIATPGQVDYLYIDRGSLGEADAEEEGAGDNGSTMTCARVQISAAVQTGRA